MSIPAGVGLGRARGGSAEVEEEKRKAWARGIGEGRGQGWPERAAEQLGTVSGMSADVQSRARAGGRMEKAEHLSKGDGGEKGETCWVRPARRLGARGSFVRLASWRADAREGRRR